MKSSARTKTPDPITDKWLAKHLGKRSRATREVRDMPGLFVRFTVLGRIEFEARYLRSWPMRVAGMHAKNRLILGEFPAMNIEQARTERSKFTEEIRSGIDPASTRPFQRTRKGHFESAEDLFWHWFDELPEKLFSDTRVEQRVVIAEYETFIFPYVAALSDWDPINRPIEDWLDGLAEAYIEDPTVARRLMWGVKRALALAVDTGALHENPLANTSFLDLERYTAEQVKEGYL